MVLSQRVRRRRTAVATIAALGAVAGLAAGPARALGGAPTRPAPATGVSTAVPAVPAGLPAGGPPALYRSEPSLPAPSGWPFGEAFPRTSGTGRMAGGATFWTDFLYDDHGAKGAPVASPVVGLAPTTGTYTYSQANAHQNGADIFRAAVGVDATDTWWRIDWNTLADPSVPIAEFALDTDSQPATGATAWPAGAGVQSPGVDRALVMAGNGAWLIDPVAGSRRPVTELGGQLTVDPASQSFVVRLPRSVLPPVTTPWTVRLAAGVNDGQGNFAPVGPANGALPGQPAVYNVAFRSIGQERPAGGNYWMEAAQAQALASGDVSPFALRVDWAALARRRTEPEPAPTGFTDRWYVSSIQNLGQGVIGPDNNAGFDDRPNYLGRVQPYAVYVPTSYDASHAVPITWILHSLSEQHNQYGVLAPKLLDAFCEKRQSICVTTLGRGPDGWYYDEAEVDFWEVWNQVASAYRLDPTRTAISGYSMGGFGTYKLGLSYPSLFARAVPMAAAVWCLSSSASPHCTNDYNTYPLLDNGRWLPFAIFQGGIDEFGLVVDNSVMTERLDLLGYRYRYEIYPNEDHLVWLQQDNLTSAAQYLDGRVQVDPGHITFNWYPDLTVPSMGIGASGAWWISGVAGTAAAGSVSTIDAVSHARPDPAVTTVAGAGPAMLDDGTPGVYRSQSWLVGTAPPPSPVIDLTLTAVSALTVDVGRAGMPVGTITVTTDEAVTLTVVGTRSGSFLVQLPAGTHTVAVR